MANESWKLDGTEQLSTVHMFCEASYVSFGCHFETVDSYGDLGIKNDQKFERIKNGETKFVSSRQI